MNPSKHKGETPLQRYLFYKGQIYFQILCVAALLAGTIILKSIFNYYALPEYLFKIIILIGFSLTILVIGLQAYLHHYIISRGVAPLSWLSKELKEILSKLNQQTSSQPANIPDLEKGLKDILASLDYYREEYREVKSLMATLENLIELLRHYWQAATRNEVLAAIGRVSAEVAHDLKSPLSSIQVALQQLRTCQKDDPKFQSYLNLLDLSSNRLLGVTNNLLAKYRGETEERGIFSIHQILDELVGEYQYQDQYGAIQFLKEYHPNDLYLEGDRHAIQRLFGNLIKNGAEAMQCVGKITLKTKSADNKLVVEVDDTGCGIPTNKLDKIFGDYTAKAEGHGIGLQFVKKTATEHQGMVWVESVFGEGSHFFVELPIASRDAIQVTSFTLDINLQEPIVIIDDDPSALEQWRLVLKNLKREANTYLSYEAFLEKTKGTPDSATAIIDYHFDNSELNGLEIIEKLKEQGFKNLYLCTAEYWKPSLKKQAEELGVAICPKPLPKILVKTIEAEKKTEEGYTVLVIDDDEGIRLSWNCLQEKLHIERLYIYSNLEALIAENLDLRTIDIAFVDKNIRASQYSGAEVIAYLKSRGVVKVVLASGESEKALRQDPALAQVDFISGDKIPPSFKEFFC